jgi:8-oxo-dGTP pyrophosphatase MutT (NUDIX family)
MACVGKNSRKWAALRAGCIVFKWHDNKLSCVLVESRTGSYSYPKGRRELGETTLETAQRETDEETGIKKDDVNIVKDFTINEYLKKDVLSVVYHVAFLKEEKNDLILKHQESELISAKYFDINDLLKLEKLNSKRKNIIRTVLMSERVIIDLIIMKQTRRKKQLLSSSNSNLPIR